MKAVAFNTGWTFLDRCAGVEARPVTLPHDAMIHELRRSDAPGGSGHGFFPGGSYLYEKVFSAPEEWREKTVSVLFDGIYKNAVVSLNGLELARHAYGYTPFSVCLDGALRYGAENTLSVSVDNTKLPNSRWYSGSGIYRPVRLLTAEKTHILWQGVFVTTVSCDPPEIRVVTESTGGEAHVDILDGERVIARADGSDVRIVLPGASLWSEDTPRLYTARVTLRCNGATTDEAETSFGVRTLSWSSRGLFLNGKKILLRGGCVHHDNGIIGACSFAESEERKVRIMKEAGFNAIRSAHNPCSPAMLDACDKYGVYLMDETFDMWYMAKTKYDYHLDFDADWQADTRAMVERDRSPPSVLLYSIGNEVSEPCEPKGVETARHIVDFIHGIDATRAVTCGANLMIISRAAAGKGIYQDNGENAKKQKEASKKELTGNASLMFNIMASFVGGGMNMAANSSKTDRLVTPFLDALDISGYNYASGRYRMDGKKHPERLIFGSETFPQDIAKNWAMVKTLPHLCGDFMWAGWDYLGEAGIGAWSYSGGLPFARPYPWLLAGSGAIDINGVPDGSCRYAAAVWGKNDGHLLAVRPVNHPGQRPTKSVWRGTNAIESWSWAGCDGNRAEIEVYADAFAAELFLNGKSLGRKKIRKYQARFKARYTPGRLEAVVYRADGGECGRCALVSAAGKLRIGLEPERTVLRPGGVAYIPVTIRGENGAAESNADRTLSVSVSGGELLGFGSAEPCTEQRFDTGVYSTLYGRALAVVRAVSPGILTLSVKGEGLADAVCRITVEE